MECRALTRRRVFEPGHLEAGNLKRCLASWDLAGLGVGSTLGVGVYVLIGYVALHLAGPSVVLSVLIAAVAALLAGLCFAEFGCRVPRAGSSYIYTYVTLGELLAFFVGWCNIFECLFGTASIARGLSMYVDIMTNNTMSQWLTVTTPISSTVFSPYFDILAFLVVIAVGILVAVGARETAWVNNVFAGVNLAVILFVVFAGAGTATPSNWFIAEDVIPSNHGVGGFFPYGVWGTLKGAAICFYGFVGFETVSASSEEARNPRRDIPYIILTVIGIAFLGYTSVAIVITMMVPYYLQDPLSAVTMAFDHVGWGWAMWLVSVSSLFGITAGLIGAMFPLPRLLYAMSSDGLFFGFFSKLTPKRKSPAIATALSAGVIATLAGILELEELIMMMCLGTLFSYTAVAISVIVLRYRSDYIPEGSPGYVKRLFGCGDKIPTQASARIIDISLGLFILLSVIAALVVVNVEDPTILSAVLNVLILVVITVMAVQPKIKEELSFKTPLVPLLPCISIYINIHLMVLINAQTWIRTLVWIVLGIPMYFLCIYCYKRKKDKLENNIALSFGNINDRKEKSPVHIVVESPTPPDTIARFSNYGGEISTREQETEMKKVTPKEIHITDEIVLHKAYVENSEEKEAKIIDLLDQVLQAEEDSYQEIIIVKESKEDASETETTIHRKSLSELSDAGSDASLGNQGLSKYDVIAQVHREDLPRVNEEEERIDREVDIYNENITEHEQVTAFNDSDTSSRTDESGYFDTLDRNALNEPLDDSKGNTFYIPVPPPLDENFFKASETKIFYPRGRPTEQDEDNTRSMNSSSSLSDDNNTNEDSLYIPAPPPMDENFFKTPEIKKFYSLSSRRRNLSADDDEEEHKPRESIKSNNSQSDDNITFGSDRQVSFMSKLNNIYQNKITTINDDEPRRRSHSTGNVTDNSEFSVAQPPPFFLDLKKELLSGEVAQNLRPVHADDTSKDVEELNVEGEDNSLSRQDLKSKLESIFAIGGPKLLKPRLMKSNPPTPEEAYQTDTSSNESIARLSKIEKNDTLKRQKAKFGDVLNSFRLSLNKDDDV